SLPDTESRALSPRLLCGYLDHPHRTTRSEESISNPGALDAELRGNVVTRGELHALFRAMEDANDSRDHRFTGCGRQRRGHPHNTRLDEGTSLQEASVCERIPLLRKYG